MFEHLDRDDHEDGSEERFRARLVAHDGTYGSRRRHHVWWFVHNCIAHPLIGVCPIRLFFRFHDYTARRINAVEEAARPPGAGPDAGW